MVAALLFAVSSGIAFAQSGGTFEIERSVIAGGGANASGGSFSVVSTIGQPIAGTRSTGGGFSLHGGFWHPEYAPTAAAVSVSGRIIYGSRGLPGITVRIFGGHLETPRVARSSGFGYFHFDGLLAGNTYVVQVENQRYIFKEPVQVIYLTDSVTDIQFIASTY